MNRILRRADWRFLLSEPSPARVICFAHGSLAQAVSEIAPEIQDVQRVEGELLSHNDEGAAVPPPSSAVSPACDLAVVSKPDRDSLARAWSALRPGGELYTERYSPFSGGERGIITKLESLGFEQIAVYIAWPWPWLRRTYAWVPLRTDAAHRYLRRQIFRDWPSLVRVSYAAIWWLQRNLPWLSLPLCATASKPGGNPEKSDGAMLLLTGGSRSTSKAVGLIFRPGGEEPSIAIKMSRVPESADSLAREAEALRLLQEAASGGLPGVPSMLWSERTGPVFRVAETAASGVQVWQALRPENFETLALQAAAWLAGLTVAAGRSAKRKTSRDVVEAIAGDFLGMYGQVLRPGEWDYAASVLRAMDDLPSIPEHRDFSPWNVKLNDRDEFVVLDWESSVVDGLPCLDLTYFLAYLAFFRDGALKTGRYVATYRSLLRPETATGAVFQNAMWKYVRELSLKEEAVAPLRMLTWMVHAKSEYMRAEADGSASFERLSRGLFLSLWREELALSRATAAHGVPC